MESLKLIILFFVKTKHPNRNARFTGVSRRTPLDSPPPPSKQKITPPKPPPVPAATPLRRRTARLRRHLHADLARDLLQRRHGAVRQRAVELGHRHGVPGGAQALERVDVPALDVEPGHADDFVAVHGRWHQGLAAPAEDKHKEVDLRNINHFTYQAQFFLI